MRAFIVAAKVEAQETVSMPVAPDFSPGITELVQRSTATLFRYSVSVRLPKADSRAPAVSVDELNTGLP
jgi:hypothetical protein